MEFVRLCIVVGCFVTYALGQDDSEEIRNDFVSVTITFFFLFWTNLFFSFFLHRIVMIYVISIFLVYAIVVWSCSQLRFNKVFNCKCQVELCFRTQSQYSDKVNLLHNFLFVIKTGLQLRLKFKKKLNHWFKTLSFWNKNFFKNYYLVLS